MESKNILITGASGNIGYEIIRGFREIGTRHKIIAGTHNPENGRKVLAEFGPLDFRNLNFADQSTFNTALDNIDIVFLLRPPQLADVHKYFAPFTKKMKEKGIEKVVFLSVQGVEKQKYIPHFKMERLIEKEGFGFVFLRPGYFMQNLTTTLLNEIKFENKIFIPSGKLKFNWVDARDIGLACAHILNNFENFKNKSYEITGQEFMGFKEVARIITGATGKIVTYESPNLIKFFRAKRKLGISKPMILVLIMLHYLPRFGKNKPRLTNELFDITDKKPSSLNEFVLREKNKFFN